VLSTRPYLGDVLAAGGAAGADLRVGSGVAHGADEAGAQAAGRRHDLNGFQRGQCHGAGAYTFRLNVSPC